MKSIRKLGVLIVCWLFASLSTSIYSQTINCNSKDVANMETVTQLPLAGVIDARDVAFVRDNISNLYDGVTPIVKRASLLQRLNPNKTEVNIVVEGLLFSVNINNKGV